MLTYKEKADVEARLAEVDEIVARWRGRGADVAAEIQDEFRERLLVSLIYHDAALEGAVLTHSEINAAIDPTIISDTSLIPAYEEIKRLHAAQIFSTELSGNKKRAIDLELVREICVVLHAEDETPDLSYRSDNPLHRLYYHEITQPEKIPEQMDEFGTWLDNANTSAMHPIERAAVAHHKLMRIYPWAKNTGRCARLLSNVILERSNCPRAVIHSIDRQDYYEALRNEEERLVLVYLDAVQTTARSEIQVYDEAARSPRRRRHA